MYKTVSLASLCPHPQNYNSHPQAQLDELKASLLRFGQVKPIVCQATAAGSYLVLAGHGLREAALQLVDEGHELYAQLTIAIVDEGWSQAQARAYMLADNEIARKARSDEYKLAELLQEQLDDGYDLLSVGSSEDELHKLLERLGDEVLHKTSADKLPDAGDAESTEIGERWAVVIECSCEQEQVELLDRFQAEGRTCRAVVL